MAYCSKCGIELDKGWAHCPACGQEIVKVSKVQERKIKIKETHPKTPETLSALDDEDSYFNTKIEIPPAKSDPIFKEFRGYLIATLIILLCLVLISTLSNKSPESGTTTDGIATTKSEIFGQIISDYRNAGCKPETFLTDSGSMQMNVDFTGEYIELDPTSEYLNRTIDIEEWNTLGNQVDRALYNIQSYQSMLSNLYYFIFDIYRDYGMGKYGDQFKIYLDSLNRDAKELCYESSPSNEQFQLAEKYTTLDVVNNLDLAWQRKFQSWIDEVWATQEKATVRYDRDYAKKQEDNYEDTVYCEEKNTSLEDYKLIKCYP